jgi:hypothetical protein
MMEIEEESLLIKREKREGAISSQTIADHPRQIPAAINSEPGPAVDEKYSRDHELSRG